MGHRFAEIAFTESVREVQQALGSRAGYTAMEAGEDYNHLLGEREAEFIAARDSFYMASVSETGWPYVQHRGGPAGFVRILGERTIGFADFRGNRQYVSVGNVSKDDRVALFFMDYPNRTRLKLLGRVRLIGPEEAELLGDLEVDDYRARVERGFLIHVEAFDWNCPQHITPRYTEAQIEALMAPLIEENRALKVSRAKADAARPQVFGDGPLELVVSGLRQLTPRVRAFELRDPSGAPLPRLRRLLWKPPWRIPGLFSAVAATPAIRWAWSAVIKALLISFAACAIMLLRW
jgi:predicted pyridoxine 5'-phosphate oxidase superfamily flavin-nucleotide-binding protein